MAMNFVYLIEGINAVTPDKEKINQKMAVIKFFGEESGFLCACNFLFQTSLL